MDAHSQQIGGRSTRTPIDDLVDGWKELLTFIQQGMYLDISRITLVHNADLFSLTQTRS